MTKQFTTSTGRFTDSDGNEFVRLVATIDQTEVANATLYLNFHDDLNFLERIDVAAGYQGQGIGSMILKSLSSEYGEFFLAPDNEDAARLYDRLGFELSESDYSEFGFAYDDGFGIFTI